jgi:hypothetical protein
MNTPSGNCSELIANIPFRRIPAVFISTSVRGSISDFDPALPCACKDEKAKSNEAMSRVNFIFIL